MVAVQNQSFQDGFAGGLRSFRRMDSEASVYGLEEWRTMHFAIVKSNVGVKLRRVAPSA